MRRYLKELVEALIIAFFISIPFVVYFYRMS